MVELIKKNLLNTLQQHNHILGSYSSASFYNSSVVDIIEKLIDEKIREHNRDYEHKSSGYWD